MKRIKDIKDYAWTAYYVGYTVKVASCILLNELFHFKKRSAGMCDPYMPICIGEMVETDKYDKIPVTDTPLGTSVKMISQSTGWVVDVYTNKDRPGSAVIYRVLFPDGVFWVSHCWVRKQQ